MTTQTVLVNAWRLYSDHVTKIDFTEFNIEIIESPLKKKEETPSGKPILEELAGPKSVSRKRCIA